MGWAANYIDRGRINGWVGAGAIHGECVKVEP